jgi:DNA repair protein RadC
MIKIRNEIIPFETFKNQDLLISQALACLEARLWRGLDILNNLQDVIKYLRLQLAGEQDEVFGVIFFDSNFHLLAFEKLFYGTINEAAVYPRRIVRKALELNAAKIVLAHNHPSGNCNPSDSDIEVSKEIRKILTILDIDLVDHIIVSHEGSYSCVEHGLL